MHIQHSAAQGPVGWKMTGQPMKDATLVGLSLIFSSVTPEYTSLTAKNCPPYVLLQPLSQGLPWQSIKTKCKMAFKINT